MTHEQFEQEIKEIADYLGCNDAELVNEMNNLMSKLNVQFEASNLNKDNE